MKIEALKIRTLFTGLLVVFFHAALLQIVRAENIWPERPPPLGLFQTRAVFSLAAARHVEGIFVQHEHLTGEKLTLVVAPWTGSPPELSPEGLIEKLSHSWRLDTSRRGASVLLVLQQTAPNKIELGYRAGIGLSKQQVASPEDLTRFQETIENALLEVAWDEIAEMTTLWMLQTSGSPILEKPELLEFPRVTKQVSLSSGKNTSTKRLTPQNTASLPSLIGVIILVFASASLVFGSIRSSMRPQVLMGARRMIHFGVQENLKWLMIRRFNPFKRQNQNTLKIESLRGTE